MKFYVLSLVLLFVILLRFPHTKSIAEVITHRYGPSILRVIRKYESNDFKSRKIGLDLAFLENCIKNNLIPNFVKFKVANHSLKSSKVYKECQIKLLHQEIQEKKKQLNILRKKRQLLDSEVRAKIRWIDFAHVSNYFTAHNDKILDKVRLTHEKKLYNLGFRAAADTHDPEKVIFNFSSHVLTTGEKSLLAKGLNLSIPPKRLNYADTLCPFKMLFQDIIRSAEDVATTNIDNIQGSLRNEALKCFTNYNPKLEQNLSSTEIEGLKSLMNDESVVIHKSDKGNSVVIINADVYKQRMKELLSDASKFRKLKIDKGKDYNFIQNQELRIIEQLRALMSNGCLTQQEYEDLCPCGSSPGILYGLSKVHKPVVDGSPKLRPILSAVNTPTYKLSKFLVKILEPFTKNRYTPKDSFAFADDICKQDSSLYMGSLDADALFTNIPLKETIDICVDLLYRDNQVVNNLSKEDFKWLLITATQESFILFDGEYYKQLDGVVMGSPLGPTLANIFLSYHEQNWLDTCPAEYKPVYYARYVDDICVLFRKSEHLIQFKRFMNEQHPNMHFTSEVEENNVLPFLDINIIRDGDRFVTSVYRKKTFSGVYTNYNSFLPDIYKFNLVSTLLYRAYRISSSWVLIHQEILKLKSVMQKNGYPIHIIDKIINRFLMKQCSSKVAEQPRSKKKTLQIILPFLGLVSRRLEKTLKAVVEHNAPGIKVVVIYRAASRLSSLFKFKDSVPSYLWSRVVYKYSCGGCNSTYIGKTKRHTKRRFSEHLGISHLTDKTVKVATPTNVFAHNKQCKCEASRDDFTILCRDTSNSDYILRTKESLYIHAHKPNLNGQKWSIPLRLFNN